MRSYYAWIALVCVWNAACWDFIEPDLAAENGAAVLQLSATMDQAGNLTANATLSPGIDADGFRRRVSKDTLRVLDFTTPSDTVLGNGYHLYALAGNAGIQATTRGVTAVGPSLEGIAFTPVVRWYVPRKADPDTVRIIRGADLLLHIAADTITPSPPAAEQWILDLAGGERRFQISANGRPPAQLRIPAEWVPQPPNGVVHASFTMFQSTQILTADYRAFMSFTTSTSWMVIVR